MATTYKIGEAAQLLNLKAYVLRFWETEFPQIAPLRTEKGQRLYTPEHIALLERIRFLLHERGLTIEGARRALKEDAARGAQYEGPAVAVVAEEVAFVGATGDQSTALENFRPESSSQGLAPEVGEARSSAAVAPLTLNAFMSPPVRVATASTADMRQENSVAALEAGQTSSALTDVERTHLEHNADRLFAGEMERGDCFTPKRCGSEKQFLQSVIAELEEAVGLLRGTTRQGAL